MLTEAVPIICPGGAVLTNARILSIVSVLLTVVAVDSWRMHILPWGFEATGYVALLSLILAAIAAISTLGLVLVRARSAAGLSVSTAFGPPSVCSSCSRSSRHAPAAAEYFPDTERGGTCNRKRTARMSYLKVSWHHVFPDEPTVLYSEIDEDRWEHRKVYVFRDGRFGYASETEATSSVELSLGPLPPLSKIGSDAQFDPEEIKKQEFEDIWSKAHLATTERKIPGE